VKGLVDLAGEFETRQVHFRGLTDGIDTKTPVGRFFFHVMASLSQMERELVVERTRAGLGAARKLGRIGGRPRRMTRGKMESARQLLAGGMPPRDVARNLAVSVPTLYRWLPAACIKFRFLSSPPVPVDVFETQTCYVPGARSQSRQQQ